MLFEKPLLAVPVQRRAWSPPLALVVRQLRRSKALEPELRMKRSARTASADSVINRVMARRPQASSSAEGCMRYRIAVRVGDTERAGLAERAVAMYLAVRPARAASVDGVLAISSHLLADTFEPSSAVWQPLSSGSCPRACPNDLSLNTENETLPGSGTHRGW